MSKLTNRLAEIDRQRELADYWGPLAEAAGFVVRGLTAVDLLFLGGAIIHDHETWLWAHTPQFTTGLGIDTDWVGALQALSEDDRAALRQRINYKPLLVMKNPAGLR